jgi:hypothetical protein
MYEYKRFAADRYSAAEHSNAPSALLILLPGKHLSGNVLFNMLVQIGISLHLSFTDDLTLFTQTHWGPMRALHGRGY